MSHLAPQGQRLKEGDPLVERSRDARIDTFLKLCCALAK
jgi:hypothetical protein